MTGSGDTAQQARGELLTLLDQLCSLARDTGEADQEAFFARIRAGVQHAVEGDDLADPFMELSTAAFRGFVYSAPVAFLLDRVLAIAQTFATTLSAPSDAEH